ncbi:NUDIX hydrolase [Roseixanthobacter pseudopolyaromaticivorans]|uniref:NUDIX hydrolase n=1 Tax=Xanthobacteraceae TaxID=335928 RepID=UPI00372BB29F
MTAALPHNASREILFQKMPITSDKPSLRRLQYAALPYRQRQDGEVQIRLITSRETRRWVVPKGWPIKGLTPSQTAAREAYEEAGLIGAMAHAAVGLYSYEKRLSPTRSVSCDVMVFPMKVKRYVKKWPERLERVGFWFSAESAAAAVQEEGLGQLILQFAAALTARHAAKLAALEEEKAAKSVAKGSHKRKGLEEPVAAEGEAAPPNARPRDAEPAIAGKLAAKKRAPKKAEAKKPEAKKDAPKKAEPKKAASKKAAPKKGAVGPADIKKADLSAASSASPAAGKGQRSDDDAGTGEVVLGVGAGNQAPEKIGTGRPKPQKLPAKKALPREPAAKKQPNKAAGVKALKAVPPGSANGVTIETRGAVPTPHPTEPSLESGARVQPAAGKKAGPQKTGAEKNDRKKPSSKKAADKKTGTKKAVGKKESAKKANPKKGERDSSLGVASSQAPAAVREARAPADALTSDR